ncbi:MAG: peptide chain release factor N(5)-glutamine methyltransferase [Clostridiales bacterium]|jgi:release factor glutamine methyltransferase|nr:peptide chain release factor N(5)-glutamine methyltransferase [Clostridiales bacterium]
MTNPTVDAALRFGASRIGMRESVMVLSRVTGKTREELLTHNERRLNRDDIQNFESLTDRRARGEPLQYILGSWPFYGLEISCDKRALIPRQDTEVLVEAVARHIDGMVGILDLCTGSGCVALALASLPNTAVTASDISAEALGLAAENAKSLGYPGIRFIRSDLFSQIPEGERFNIITANPPYIPSSEVLRLSAEVRDYEPLLALDGGGDGLDIYRRLIPESKNYLSPGGALFLEVGPAAGVAALMESAGFNGIQTVSDYAGLPRVVYGVL